MKDKGQALIEFVLVLPIIILIFVALIDIGNIFVQKYNLNNCLETITDLYQNGNEKELQAFVAKEDIIYSENKNGELVTLNVEKEIKVTAPVLSNVLGKRYHAKESKTIYVNNSEESHE